MIIVLVVWYKLTKGFKEMQSFSACQQTDLELFNLIKKGQKNINYVSLDFIKTYLYICALMHYEMMIYFENSIDMISCIYICVKTANLMYSADCVIVNVWIKNN